MCIAVQAQEFKDIQLSPKHTIFFSISSGAVLKDNEPVRALRLRYLTDNIDIPLDRIRFLAVKEIQEELKLSESEKNELNKLLKLLEEFEQVEKSNYYASAFAVSDRSKKKVAEFVEKISDFEKRKVLSKQQLRRLDQLRVRFNCLGTDATNKESSDIFNRVKNELRLSTDQITQIQKIVNDELGDELEIESQLRALEELLDDEQQKQIRTFFKPLVELSTPVGLSFAQCKEFVKFPALEKGLSGDFDLELVDGSVLNLTGKLAVESVYLDGGKYMVAAQPWRNILKQILGGKMDWLELSSEQQTALQSLIELEPSEEGPGIRRYFGDDALAEIGEWPKADWNPNDYLDWLKKLQQARCESDRRLGEKMRTILMPHQVDSITVALSASRLLEIGPNNILLNNLDDILKLSRKQKEEIVALRDKRLKKLQSIYSKIDRKVESVLTVDQKSWVSRNLGKSSDLYPSVWLFF
jgi:hypothetical protein